MVCNGNAVPKFSGYTVEVVDDPPPVRRSWRERWFSRPWRPWRRWRPGVGALPAGTVILIEDTMYIRREEYDRLTAGQTIVTAPLFGRPGTLAPFPMN